MEEKAGDERTQKRSCARQGGGTPDNVNKTDPKSRSMLGQSGQPAVRKASVLEKISTLGCLRWSQT